MSQPLLSIGMIVKNEERSLEKCLKALAPLRQAIPCELVIADTGSTDKTKEIAEKYADILFDFKWVNDFSKARNAVMDKCSGKWYLTVDADEYLVPDIEELVAFLTSPISEKKQQATLVQRNHFSVNMDGAYSDFNAGRMCRMNTGVRYVSSIHEYFDTENVTLDDFHILNNTIFDHDGYAQISPEHRKQKEERNLELLKVQLEKEPDNLRIILQCLESSAFNYENRKYYTSYAMEKLKKANTSDEYWISDAAAMALQIATNLDLDDHPLQEEWFNWTFKTFKNSDHIDIDAKYIYTKHLFLKERYLECIKSGKEYLSNLSKQKDKSNVATLEKLYVTLHNANEIHRDEIKIIVAFAMVKENRSEEALKFLSEIDLLKQNKNNIENWFKTIKDLSVNNKSVTSISKVISDFLKNSDKEQCKLHNLIISEINKIFNSATQNNTFKLLGEVHGTIGISAKLCEVKTKKEAEKLINSIENWEYFSPVALKQFIILKADLPKEFFLLPTSQLDSLINYLCASAEDFEEPLINYYCDEEQFKNFPELSFIYKLVSAILFNNSNLSSDIKTELLNKFNIISDCFLNMCYNTELLQNEDMIQFVPELHLFSWYFVKATTIKKTNALEYLKTLRVALEKVPKSKAIVEFLIENFQNEEQQKKQEQIKNVAPELVQMAEQLKVMLSAFPENSPELLAIKQSPMYKQVAFLIED